MHHGLEHAIWLHLVELQGGHLKAISFKFTNRKNSQLFSLIIKYRTVSFSNFECNQNRLPAEHLLFDCESLFELNRESIEIGEFERSVKRVGC